LENEITDRSCIKKVITDYIAYYAPFPEFLLCTLSINPFTVDPNGFQIVRYYSIAFKIGETNFMPVGNVLVNLALLLSRIASAIYFSAILSRSPATSMRTTSSLA
jgi:hypothetical protein